jgi:hypothetical protein
MNELKEIRGYKKEDMLYPDRCMMKWQGMLLSDHKEALTRGRGDVSCRLDLSTAPDLRIDGSE